MDPLALYTVKLAMARKERDNHHKHERVHKENEIPFDVFHMETSASNGQQPPKLEKQNLLSLVYYAGE